MPYWPGQGLLSKLRKQVARVMEYDATGLNAGGGRRVSDYTDADIEAGAQNARNMQNAPSARKDRVRRRGDVAAGAGVAGLLTAAGARRAAAQAPSNPAVALSLPEARLLLQQGGFAADATAPPDLQTTNGWDRPVVQGTAGPTTARSRLAARYHTKVRPITNGPLGMTLRTIPGVGDAVDAVASAGDAGGSLLAGNYGDAALNAVGGFLPLVSAATLRPLVHGLVPGNQGGLLGTWGKTVGGAPFASRLARSLTDIGVKRGAPASQLVAMARKAPHGVANAEADAFLAEAARLKGDPAAHLTLTEAEEIAARTNPGLNMRGTDMEAARMGSPQTPGNSVVAGGSSAYEGYSFPRTRGFDVPLADRGESMGVQIRSANEAERGVPVMDSHFTHPVEPSFITRDNLLGWTKSSLMKDTATGEATRLIDEIQTGMAGERGAAAALMENEGWRQLLSAPDAMERIRQLKPVAAAKIAELKRIEDEAWSALGRLPVGHPDAAAMRKAADNASGRAMRMEEMLTHMEEQAYNIGGDMAQGTEAARYATPHHLTPFENPHIGKSPRGWLDGVIANDLERSSKEGIPLAVTSSADRAEHAQLGLDAADLIYGLDSGAPASIMSHYDWLGQLPAVQQLAAKRAMLSFSPRRPFGTSFHSPDPDATARLIEKLGLPALPKGSGRGR